MKSVGSILKKLHNLETMAVQIYRVQIPLLNDPAEREMMTAAMKNEAHHRETFRSLLVRHGLAPSPLRFFWWIVGNVLGMSTGLLGRTALLKGDIAFEQKAVHEYTEFAAQRGFDTQEAAFLREFLEDEKRHVANWKSLLGKGR